MSGEDGGGREWRTQNGMCLGFTPSGRGDLKMLPRATSRRHSNSKLKGGGAHECPSLVILKEMETLVQQDINILFLGIRRHVAYEFIY